VIVLDDDATGKLCKRWQGPATVVRVKSSYDTLIWATAVFVMCMQTRCVNFMCVCTVVILSVRMMLILVVLVSVIDENDVLPDGSVDRGRVEYLDPGQQGELTDEFAACFSDEPVLCRVCGIWLLFVFLVCGVVALSMTVCLECRIVKFLCLFGTVAVRGKGRLESCVSVLCYCCVRSYVNSHSAILCLVSVRVCYLRLFGAVSPLLRGVEVQRADCATNCCSRICQRSSIGWSWLSIATPVLCYFNAGNA